MLTYQLSSPEPQKGFLHIDFFIDDISTETIEIQLPAWRPGRYELQNYAKNVQHIQAFDKENNTIFLHKSQKDRWIVETKGINNVRIQYSYFARQMDAGGSWIDDKMWYINFVNCLMYVDSRLNEPCKVQLELPDGYEIASGLKNEKNSLLAKDYYEIADSPAIASPTLQHTFYEINDTIFHLWIQGDYVPDWAKWKKDFELFSFVQRKMMNGFPFSSYHFLIHILPNKFYHGVEHRNSTVITIGVDKQDKDGSPIDFESVYKSDLLGICSHELFHTWNVCRIRPEELLPYDFTKENYFTTGYIIEGITTYYGDLFLARSGIYNRDEYFMELSKTLNRHFNTSNNACQSLLESSYDLWLDGYTAGIPDKKVSIYHKGCLIALILDIEIRKYTNNERSLDDIMKIMWEKFGKPFIGYSHDDFLQVLENTMGKELKSQFYENCISGRGSLLKKLQENLDYVGCEVAEKNYEKFAGGISIEIILNKNRSDKQNENLKNWLK